MCCDEPFQSGEQMVKNPGLLKYLRAPSHLEQRIIPDIALGQRQAQQRFPPSILLAL